MSESPEPDPGRPRSTWRQRLARLLGDARRPAQEPARTDELERTYWRTADEMGDVLPNESETKTNRRQR